MNAQKIARMNAQRHVKIIVICLVLALISAGCFGRTGPQPASGTPSGDAAIDPLAYTQSAATIGAELTLNAPPTTEPQAVETEPPAQPTPTDEPLPPTSTPLPTDTPLPTETPAPTATLTPVLSPTASLPPEPAWELSFYDDFTTTRAWVDQTGGLFRLNFAAGGYRIASDTVGDIVFSTRSDQFSGVRIEVNARRLSGPDDAYFGVICNFVNGGNYYMLGVGADGWYGIVKKQIGQISYLAEGSDPSGMLRQTSLTGTSIRGDCFDGQLVLWVNGTRVLETRDASFAGGAVGMGVGTRGSSGVEVHFEDFYLYTIAAPAAPTPMPTP